MPRPGLTTTITTTEAGVAGRDQGAASQAPAMGRAPVIPEPFRSPEALLAAFTDGLGRRLHGGPAALLMVLANARFDPCVGGRLEAVLRRRLESFARDRGAAVTAGLASAGPNEDLAVLERLISDGLDPLAPCRRRGIGPWEVQLNPLRALRPPRAAGRPPARLQLPFDPGGFHFNRPSLREEAFWTGRLEGVEVELLYNKYPFVERHLLLLPEREACQPQYLTAEAHRWVWRLAERLGGGLPGLGLGYNSLGAFASVNHLHLQMFVRRDPLPLALDRWEQNGGGQPYPVACERYIDPEHAWQRLADLQRGERRFNLVYLPGRLYCLPRRPQGTYRLPTWCQGQAWYELAGGVVVAGVEDYRILTAEAIGAALGLAREAPGAA